ncbi:uncharacterized protein P884DRAFT_268009 [Thermothelomyces heterothallicus CBS 202.75]|uniref:uncharacterized protein n=1 Tax=Thermothelomyces heterothallicus CBS 202.75 TaxID=1149848 RepID=UPI0037444D14
MAYIWNQAAVPDRRGPDRLGQHPAPVGRRPRDAALSVLAEPWRLRSVNIQPTTQGSRAIHNTVVIILILIKEFFYLGTINGLHAQLRLYARLATPSPCSSPGSSPPSASASSASFAAATSPPSPRSGRQGRPKGRGGSAPARRERGRGHQEKEHEEPGPPEERVRKEESEETTPEKEEEKEEEGGSPRYGDGGGGDTTAAAAAAASGDAAGAGEDEEDRVGQFRDERAGAERRGSTGQRWQQERTDRRSSFSPSFDLPFDPGSDDESNRG